MHSTVAVLVAIGLCTSATFCWAGFDEGFWAYQRGDYATALREFRLLAEQGDADAQYNLGVMYANGHGMPQAMLRRCSGIGRAAEQGLADAQDITSGSCTPGRAVAYPKIMLGPMAGSTSPRHITLLVPTTRKPCGIATFLPHSSLQLN